MNRLRRGRNGWVDQVNPVRAVVLACLSSVAAACVGVMLLGVLPRAWKEGDGVVAAVAVLVSVFNVYHAVQLGRAALDEVRGR